MKKMANWYNNEEQEVWGNVITKIPEEGFEKIYLASKKYLCKICYK